MSHLRGADVGATLILTVVLTFIGCANPVVHKKAERRLPGATELRRVNDEFIEKTLAPPKPAETAGLFLDGQDEYWYVATYRDEVSAADLEGYQDHLNRAGHYYRPIGPSGHNPLGNVLRYEQCFLRRVERKHWAVAMACFWTSDLPGSDEGFTDAAVPYHRDGRRLLVYLGDPQEAGIWKVIQPMPDSDRVRMKEFSFGRAPGLVLSSVSKPSPANMVRVGYVGEMHPMEFYQADYATRLNGIAECRASEGNLICKPRPGTPFNLIRLSGGGVTDIYELWGKVRPDLFASYPKFTGFVGLEFWFRTPEDAQTFYRTLSVQEPK